MTLYLIIVHVLAAGFVLVVLGLWLLVAIGNAAVDEMYRDGFWRHLLTRDRG
jgi:hypothetical protein